MSYFRCEKTCPIKSDMCEHVFTPFMGIGDEGMTLLNSCQGDKELGKCFKFQTYEAYVSLSSKLTPGPRKETKIVLTCRDNLQEAPKLLETWLDNTLH